MATEPGLAGISQVRAWRRRKRTFRNRKPRNRPRTHRDSSKTYARTDPSKVPSRRSLSRPRNRNLEFRNPPWRLAPNPYNWRWLQDLSQRTCSGNNIRMGKGQNPGSFTESAPRRGGLEGCGSLARSTPRRTRSSRNPQNPSHLGPAFS